ncbi:hypothetical protein BGZ46_006224 [Entomortierella lignicola]|nr:hypothetical protein BGZ46_006224 [Entomortierella lignicola]
MSGLRTPSRIGKRTRYITDAELLGSSMDREQQEQQFENNNVNENSDPQTGATVAGTTGTTATTTTTSTTPEANPSIQSELEQTKRLVSVFETIDLSVTEARDKLKVNTPVSILDTLQHSF